MRFSTRGAFLYNRAVPAPPKVTKPQIMAAARALLERNGRDGFTMADVAASVGVRAPSLYGHFADRAALLEELELSLWIELGKSLASCVIEHQPIETLKSQAAAYRSFAKRYRNGYALMYDVRSKHTEQGARVRAEAVASTLSVLIALVGRSQALVAARVLTPYLHGFVSMENSAAFRLGSGLDEAFEYGVDTILRGLTAAPPTNSGSESSKRKRRPRQG